MNMKSGISIEKAKEIFMACDDNAGHHILWIDKNGEVHLDRVPEELSPIGFQESKISMQCRFETYTCGCGYVGPEAAKDDKYMENICNSLEAAWTKYKGQEKIGYIDY